jgi:hypothetical protein
MMQCPPSACHPRELVLRRLPCRANVHRTVQAILTQDLVVGRKLDYDSALNLLHLFERAGGIITRRLRDAAGELEARVARNPLLQSLEGMFEQVGGAGGCRH